MSFLVKNIYHKSVTTKTLLFWGVEGNGQGLSLQERTSHTYTLKLGYNRILLKKQKKKKKTLLIRTILNGLLKLSCPQL